MDTSVSPRPLAAQESALLHSLDSAIELFDAGAARADLIDMRAALAHLLIHAHPCD